jgi:MFS family permease
MAAIVRRAPFYGWIMVASLSLTQVVSWGIVYYSFSVFMTPMTHELGWTQTQVAGGFSAAQFVSGLVALPIGRFIDRRGARSILLAGSCLAATLLVAWSRVHTLAAFYAIWLGMGVAMAAVLYEPAFAVVVAWFRRRRALALTVLTSIGGLASTIFVPAVAALIATSGWRTSLLYLAGLLALINIPLYAGIVRSRPGDLGLCPDGGESERVEALSETPVVSGVGAGKLPVRAAWLMALIFGLSTLTSAAAFVHVFPFLVTSGFSMQSAALSVAAMGASQVPARLGFGLLVRVVSGAWLAPCLFVFQALGLMCLAFASHLSALVVVFALLFGFGNGMATLVRSLLVAERFDLSRYGSISGTMAFCGQVARAVGPIGAAWLASVWAYQAVWWLLASMLCLSAIAMRLVERWPAHLPAFSQPEPSI